MIQICPPELSRLYRERRVLPFIGAGASMAVKWTVEGKERRGPSWIELVDQAAQMLGFGVPDLLHMRGNNLQILEYFRLKNGSLAPLTNWLTREMNAADEGVRTSALHKMLAGLEECQIFYTTNFDDFLERALRMHGRQVDATTSEINVSFDLARTQVIKFHGDFTAPEQMVMSETDYYRRMSLDHPMDLKLRSDLLGRTILFIGYSFRDPNVSYLFHVVQKMLKQLPDSYGGRRAYIILPDPSDFERRLFDARNIEVIPIPGADKEEGICKVLRQMTER